MNKTDFFHFIQNPAMVLFVYSDISVAICNAQLNAISNAKIMGLIPREHTKNVALDNSDSQMHKCKHIFIQHYNTMDTMLFHAF